MKKSEILLMILQIPVDFLMLLLAGVSAYYLRFTDWAISLRPVLFEMPLGQFMFIVFWVALIWLVVFAFAGLYSTDPNRKFMRDLSKVFMACSTGLAIVALYIMFSGQPFDSRFLVATGWIFAVVYVSLGRFLIRGLKSVMYRFGIGLRRVVIVGSGELASEIINILSKRKELGYKVLADFDEFNRDVSKKIKKIGLDELLFINARANEDETLSAIDFCNENHITFKYSADLFSTYSSNMTTSPLAGVPVVELKKTRLDGWGRVLKRLFDIVGSIILIIITSPIMLIASIVILIETGRPIIYKNERVGIRGSKFFTLKFRSMHQKDSTGSQFGKSGENAEKREKDLIKKQSIKKGPVYKIANDPRVTSFGRLIRRYSVDELPQFFNVLAGTMSIVGPRPHQLREVKKYKKHHKKLLTIKPGVTGLAQISGRSDLSFEEEFKLDIFYIEKWSPVLDLIIFIKTPFILFKNRKAL